MVSTNKQTNRIINNMITTINEFKIHLNENISYTYKWSDYTATIRLSSIAGWVYSIKSVSTDYVNIHSGIDDNFKTAKEAEEYMFDVIEDRIGSKPARQISESLIKESIGDISLDEIATKNFNDSFIAKLNSLFTKEPTTNSDWAGITAWRVSGEIWDGHFIIDTTSYKGGNYYNNIDYELVHRYDDEFDNTQSDVIASLENKEDCDKFLELAKEFIGKTNENLLGFDKIGHISKEVTIELDLKHTQHSLGRQGRGTDYITNEDIKNAVGTATEQMVDLIIANKLNVGDSVLITRKEDRLNVVGSLSLKKGTDIINFTVITCMRVEKFLNKNNTLQIFI